MTPAGSSSDAATRLVAPRSLLALGSAIALVAGCADILGVEDVELDGAGGAGGAGSSTSDETAIGSGFPTSSGSGDTTAAGDTTSTGPGPICAGPLPACEGTLANAFESSEELLIGWELDAEEEVDIRDGSLELEPDDDSDHAAVLSKAPVLVAPLTGACAVWVTLLEASENGSAGIALGSGESSGDAVRIERRGGFIVARVGATDVGTLAAAPEVQSLRLVFDAAGTVGFEASTDLVCWSPVVAVQPRPVAEGRVRLFVDGENSKARLDDYCR